jgi:mono/diheme cytochrome c family protein
VRMIKRVAMGLVVAFALVGVATAVGAIAFLSSGISARPEPSAFEAGVAGRLRALAIPSSAKNRTNPVSVDDGVIEAGMAHWADHCALCHANNGDGQTGIGRGLYPRAPDMRQAATQQLSDGALFYIIENGVKLTGMPAWGTGTPEGEQESWKLVHFVRQLPKLTPEQIERMEAMNPRSPGSSTAEEAIRRFLEGDGPAPKSGTKPQHGGHE